MKKSVFKGLNENVLSRAGIEPATSKSERSTDLLCEGATIKVEIQLTVKPVLSSHQRKAQKSGCLAAGNISTKSMFGNIMYGCLRQVTYKIHFLANRLGLFKSEMIKRNLLHYLALEISMK